VNNEQALASHAVNSFSALWSSLGDYRVHLVTVQRSKSRPFDIIVAVDSKKAHFRFAVEVRRSLPPQIALSVAERLRPLAPKLIPVVYTPVVSPRVAHILREARVGYLDAAGNCWLRNTRHHLLIERQGFRSERKPTAPSTDLFSRKSSRIIRAVLTRPAEGWRVRSLAAHPEVQVSPGLVVKVNRALVRDGYAIERDGQVFLRDPAGLLEAWVGKYPGPAEQIPYYFRGDVATAERAVAKWSQEHRLRHAVAGFSAAWQLAPEVRYHVASVYVEDRGFDEELSSALVKRFEGKRVDTGATLHLWRPYDPSVFAFGEGNVTSPLQTYLDLRRAGGRSEDAAKAIYSKFLEEEFRNVATRAKELSRGPA
jgi:hypothetical protein